MAILEADDWPGNVRELEAVVKRAMVCRHAGWVTPEDIVLPRLRRGRLPDAMRPPGVRLTAVQEQALQLKSARGEVRRADLVARCRVSHEVARRALASLARLGLLRRVGLGRATRYVSLSFWLTFVDDLVELVMPLV
jgi:DNA-binding NtrC family response regulator